MRTKFLELLRPICPLARERLNQAAPLLLGAEDRRDGPHLLEGALYGGHPELPMEYPIIDGLPVLLADVGRFMTDNLVGFLMRDDLTAATDSRLGDALGPGTAFDALRQNLSTYAWDGYAAEDPSEPALPDPQNIAPGAARRVLEAGLNLLAPIEGPVLDMGSAVGATTFALAERVEGPVVGLDASVAMSRLAARVLRDSRVIYPRRRVGVVYDRRDFPVSAPGADNVDFWIADAQNAPFADETFGTVVALQLLDCVPDPARLLHEIARLLKPGGQALIASPYDWSPGATDPAAWIGGHSQRGPDAGAAEPLMRRLLSGEHPQAAPGLEIIGNLAAIPWAARLHDRSQVVYSAELFALRKT